MSLSSQVANATGISSLTGLTHNIFMGDVVPNVRAESPVSQLFQDAPQGKYRLEGQALIGAADLQFVNGAIATGSSGKLPDHAEVDATQWTTTPVRRFRRIALDRMTEKRASGPGSFEDYGERIFNFLWDSWGRMEIRHAIGGTSGVLCKVNARTSSTVFTVKDGYGHASTDPLMHLTEGMTIAWYDSSNSFALGGAAKITATGIAYSTKTITVDSASTWEPSAQTAVNDVIVAASTNNTTTDYFVSEYTNAPHGVGTIVDPDATATTVLGISQTTFPRWKPYRVASSTFDHLEVTEHWRQLRAKSTSPVNASTHIAVAQGGVVAQLARTLAGFQQQAGLGETFKGGYQAVMIGNMPIIEDDFFYHDVLVTLCREDLYRANLGGQADFVAEDGSEWSRLQDYDGKEAYVGDIIQQFSPRRNRHAALTGISLDITSDNFTPTPNY